jgi:ribosomal-protein-alanine N-acetyltransferase
MALVQDCHMDLTYPSPELTSDTVRIRKWTIGDLGCIEAAGTDPQIPQGTTIPAIFTEAEGRAFIERQWARNDDGQALALAIARADSDEAVGHVYLGLTRVKRQCRIGYWLIPEARRKGYGSSSVNLVGRWLLTETDIHRVVAEVHPDNVASIRLLEGCGYTLEGTLRSWLWIEGEANDAFQYSLIRTDVTRP